MATTEQDADEKLLAELGYKQDFPMPSSRWYKWMNSFSTFQGTVRQTDLAEAGLAQEIS